ncbi:UNVERIFIED_CONTAM: hypothetical protein HDU68_000139 [Siphonaria sp. JEL0065]|nr:hypothetical protein HDU68_000139 [Siphonaria sp. JEL0065]
MEHQEPVAKFTETVKAHVDEEKVHFVAGIALTGKNIVQLPYLYRNISEHYNVTRPAEDLVRRCMDPDHTHRITTIRGNQDVKTHPWFRPLNLSWKELEDGKLKPAFVPGNESDDQQIAEFLKNLNREETTSGGASSKGGAGGRSVSVMGGGGKAGGGAGNEGEDDEDVGVEEGVKDEVDAELSEAEIQVLIHNTFLHW